MNPWQLKRLREQLKEMERTAEEHAAEMGGKMMNCFWTGVATGLRDAQRALGKSSYEPRRGTKDKESEE